MLRTVTTFLTALLIAVTALAQSSRPQFEVASIKSTPIRIPMPATIVPMRAIPRATTTVTLTGILYSDHGGPSANATGEIELVVNGALYTLEYGKPFR